MVSEMPKYKTSKLKKYIDDSELVIINDFFKIRMSRELLKNYEEGLYDKAISFMSKNIEEINSLNIKYPANANPVFYVYIVPDENFKEYLNYPMQVKANGGGKPVTCYDLDGFDRAYGVSNNIMLKTNINSIMRTINNIHEFSHLVHGMFFHKDQFICEGFAELLPLYVLDYESRFEEYLNCLKTLNEEQILSAYELIKLGNSNNFYSSPIISNASISFEIPYISSYLFVRVCIEHIEKKWNLDRINATQKFLEIVRNSDCYNEWLVFDIANELGIDKDELLCGKTSQISIINNLG